MKGVVIDYGMGNLRNVQKACEKLGYPVRITDDLEMIQAADYIILPGVGAFKAAMKNLEDMQVIPLLKQKVAEQTPLLGICLGMQLLFEESEEHGLCSGLGLLGGRIKRFQIKEKIPHMGWNTLEITKQLPLFEGISQDSAVYFVHSYHLETEEDIVSAWTTYGYRIGVAVQKDNLFGMQYHPEKSGEIGMKMLGNFLRYAEEVNA